MWLKSIIRMQSNGKCYGTMIITPSYFNKNENGEEELWFPLIINHMVISVKTTTFLIFFYFSTKSCSPPRQTCVPGVNPHRNTMSEKSVLQSHTQLPKLCLKSQVSACPQRKTECLTVRAHLIVVFNPLRRKICARIHQYVCVFVFLCMFALI